MGPPPQPVGQAVRVPVPTPPPGTAALPPGQARAALPLLMAASFTSSFDRFAVGALLVSISADLDVTLGQAAGAASWYFLCYGVSQPGWGMLSDRLGRVRTMRVALSLAAAGAAASALAPTLVLLVLARAFTGATMAAVVPAVLIYVGDAVPIERRQRTLTDINAATATGITLATALAGVLAAAVSWRVAFLVPGVVAGALVVVLRRLPEPPRSQVAQGGLPAVLRSRWGLGVLALTLLEGASLLGLLTYFAPALESTGFSATTAGLVVALYGVGLLLVSRVVKRVAGRVPPQVFLALGASGLAVAYAAVALSRSGWVVGAAALLVGAAWAAMHSTMQTWATQVVPAARATMVSLFAAMLFVGSGTVTAVLAPLADQLRWSTLYALGAGIAGLFGVLAVTGRARYRPG